MAEYELRASEPDDLARIVVQPAQRDELASELPDGHVWTFLAGAEVLMIIGASSEDAGRILMWSLLSETAGRHMRRVHRVAELVCDAAARSAPRIEALAKADFPQAHRWLSMLGFVCEAERLRKFHNGVDYSLWARVNDDG